MILTCILTVRLVDEKIGRKEYYGWISRYEKYEIGLFGKEEKRKDKKKKKKVRLTIFGNCFQHIEEYNDSFVYILKV